MKKPTIDQYLLISCSLIIDELNEQYKEVFVGDNAKQGLKISVNERFSETDLTMRLGHPFRELAHYNVVDSTMTEGVKKNHDLFIESKKYKVEVKFLKNWKTDRQTNSNSKMWSEFQRDFDWVISEINNGNKGKCAFVIGWFNCVERFSEIIQLGEREDGKRTGGKPLASQRKRKYFPFLRSDKEPTYTKDLIYNYNCAYDILNVNLVDKTVADLNCIFLGDETDVFHFVIYF